MRYGGRVTIEEVLDTIFQQTPSQSQAHPYDSRYIFDFRLTEF